MNSPYTGLGARHFWRTGVAEEDPQSIAGLWKPKFEIDADARVATAGSCFAQHIGTRLINKNYNVIMREKPPRGLGATQAQEFGYSIYSARYGNIYTARQLLQLAQEAFEQFTPIDAVWEKDGRHFDAMRPSVEPFGLATPDLVKEHRARHIRDVREVMTSAEVFIFTIGLTEAWVHSASGTVYPTAPGVIAGQFDSTIHSFKNFGFQEVLDDLLAFRGLLKQHNQNVKILLTVSPVPLTATASQDHVLVATTYSKSVLRAVAGELATRFADVEYFPAYEIIATQFSRGKFYAEDFRTVTPDGVDAVMRVFFNGALSPVGLNPLESRLGARGNERFIKDRARRQEAKRRLSEAQLKATRPDVDVVCEERLLEAFSHDPNLRNR